LTFSSHT